MSRDRDQRKNVLILAVLIFLVVPISAASNVTLTEGVVIEQTANDVNINVTQSFNVSTLTAYDNATNFGGINLSIDNQGTGTAYAQMPDFNENATKGEYLTYFDLNVTDGATTQINLSNLSKNRFYQLERNGNELKNSSTGTSGEFSYSTSALAGYNNYSIKASVKDGIDVSVNTNKTASAPDEPIKVTGTVTRNITGNTVEGASVDIYVNGVKISSGGITTDSNGDFSYSYNTSKEAGEYTVEAKASKNGVTGSGTTDYVIDEILLENPQFTSVDGDSIIDADNTANATVKVYRNNQGPIDNVRYKVFEFGSLIDQGQLNNVSPRTQTQTYYKGLGGFDLGSYEIKYRADSTLNGQEIYAKKNLSTTFEIQNISVSVDTDKESYGKGSGDNVEVTGSAVKNPGSTDVTNEEVVLKVINKSSGNQIDNFTTTTNSTGGFSYSYSFNNTEGVRTLVAEINNTDGIAGNSTAEYSVTDMNINSLAFTDSDDLHAYNVTTFVSDSAGTVAANNYTCKIIVSDGEGNSREYPQTLNASYGTDNEAKCVSNPVASSNVSGWSHTENLDVRAKFIDENGVTATLSSSRSLPNNNPDIVSDTSIELTVDSDTYVFDMSAVATDTDIPGENEIESCTVTYYDSSNTRTTETGNLNTAYGSAEEAKCSYSISNTNTTLTENEVIDAKFKFTDTHNSTLTTTRVDSPAPFQAVVEDLQGNKLNTDFKFIDSTTGNHVKTLTTSSGSVYDSVPAGTYDLEIKALGKTVRLLDTSISSYENLNIDLDDSLTQEKIDKPYITEELSEFAVSGIGLSYSSAEIVMGYNQQDEKVVTPWLCDTFREDPTKRDCANPYSFESGYSINTAANKITLNSGDAEGSYALASSDDWKTGWLTRNVFEVEGSNTTLHNYQVKLKVDTQGLISEGNLASDCSDMRFYGTSQSQRLDYWLKPGTCGQKDSEIWVEIPKIPANSTRKVFMYTGQDGLDSLSSGPDTFIDFDEFNSALGSGYSTSGLAEAENGQLLLRSSDGQVASAVYQNSNIGPSYRFMAELTHEDASEVSRVGTYSQGASLSSNSIFYSPGQDKYRNKYTNTEKTLSSTTNTVELDEKIRSDSQEAQVLPDNNTKTLSGSISGSEYPFSATMREDSGTYSSMNIERWYTAKLAKKEPNTTLLSSGANQWNLYLNGKKQDINVSVDEPFDIKLNSTSVRNSDVKIFINGNEEFSAQDTTSVTFEANFSTKRYYEIKGYVNRLNKSIVRDVIVGHDGTAPTVNITSASQSGGAVKVDYTVEDNYLGDVECDAIVNNNVKRQERVKITQAYTEESSYFNLTNIPEGEVTLEVECDDQSNNTGIDSLPGITDFSPPEIKVISPNDGGGQIRVRPKLNIRLTDSTTDKIEYNISYEGSSVSKSGTLTNDTATEIIMKAPGNGYGIKDLQITATDKNGFQNEIPFTLNLTKPYVKVSVPPSDTGETTYRTISTMWNDDDNRDDPFRLKEGRYIEPDRYQIDISNPTFKYTYVTEARTSTTCETLVDGQTVNTTTAQVNSTQSITVNSIKQGFDMPFKVTCNTEASTSVSGSRLIDVDREKPNLDRVSVSPGNGTTYDPNNNFAFTAFVSDNLEEASTSQTDSYPYLEINGQDEQIVMRNNFTGTFKNYSVDCGTQTYSHGDLRPTVTVCDDYHTKSFGAIDAGTYRYNYYIRDDVGNTRVTSNRTLVIDKGSPGISWSTKPRASDGDVAVTSSTGVTCGASNQKSTLTLKRNGTTVGTSSSGSITDTENINTPGIYTYNCSIPKSENYLSGEKQFTMEVLDSVDDGINITVRSPKTDNSPSENRTVGTSDIVNNDTDWSITYGETKQTIETSARSGTADLYLNGTDVTETYQQSFTPGTYELKSNSTGSSIFNANTLIQELKVVKATPSLDMNEPSPNYGEKFKLECTSNTNQNTLKLYFNGSKVAQNTGSSVSTTLDTTNYNQDDFSQGCKSVKSENYTAQTFGSLQPSSSSSSGSGGGGTIQPTGTPTFNFDIKGATKVDQDSYRVERGVQVNVTCNTDEGTPTTLKEDGSTVSAPYVTTYTQLTEHDFRCISESTNRYRADEETSTLDVKAKTNTRLLFNGSEQSVTVSQSNLSNLNVSAILNISNDIQINTISDPDPQFDNDNDFPQEQASDGTLMDVTNALIDGVGTPSDVVPGTYRFRAKHERSDDYFYSDDEGSIEVTDITPPRLELNGVQNQEYKGTGTFNVTARTKDFSGYDCTISIDDDSKDVRSKRMAEKGEKGTYGSLKPTWGENKDGVLNDYAGYGEIDDGDGRIAYHETNSLSEGLHTVEASCTDNAGNTRSRSRTFIVDKTKPSVSISDSETNGEIKYDTSTPNITVSASDTLSGAVDVDIERVNGGTIGEAEVDGSKEVGIESLAPGYYDVFAEGTDTAGNVDTSQTKTIHITDGIYNMDPSSKGLNGNLQYVANDDIQFTYQYGSDIAPRDCSVGIEGPGISKSGIDPVNNLPNNSIGSATVKNLANGKYTWNVTCGPNSNQLYKEAKFIADYKEPTVQDTYVSRDSGKIYKNETVIFTVTADDNFNLSNATFTASWLSSHNMECPQNSNTCSYQTVVPPGDHTYSFTVCDEANNCKSTNTNEYKVTSVENTFELRLNNQTDNVTLNSTPVLNITGAVQGSERANIYFKINGSPVAQTLDTTGTRFQERFFANGTYNITANFASTVRSNTDSDTLLVNVGVNSSVISDFGYNIFNLPPGTNASLRNDPLFTPTIPGNGVAGTKKIILGEGLGKKLAAQLEVDFTADLDASDISFASSKSKAKSVIDFTRNYNKIQSHSLLVPRQQDSGKVLVCPQADVLSEVQLGCPSGVNVSAGSTVNGISNEEVVVNGQKYYHITGISGTGAQELSGDQLFSQNPDAASVTEIKTFNEFRDLSGGGSFGTYGGNITGANISGDQTTDDWAGIYGNATGGINLGQEAILYKWPAEAENIFAANHSVNWSTLQTATLTNVDSYYALGDQSDDAESTFENTTTIYLDEGNITDTPSVKTYNGTGVPTWVTGALSDGDSPVFAGKTRNNASTSFNGDLSDYQMLLPTGGSGDEMIAYSMYIDLG